MSPGRPCPACSYPAAPGWASPGAAFPGRLRRCALQSPRSRGPPAWPSSRGGSVDRRPPPESCPRSTFAASAAGGKREVENRALPRLALHPNALAVRFHNAFCDCQAHPCPLGFEAVPPASEEFIEDAGALVFFDAGAAVRDPDYDFPTFERRGNREGRAFRRVLECVLHELLDHLLDELRVGLGRGESFG